MATGTIPLQTQGAKITGAFVTDGDPVAGARIEGGSGVFKLLFDASAAWAAIVGSFDMPENYASDLVLILKYAMTSATSGTVAFDLSIMANTDGEAVDTPSFDTVNSTGAITVPGSAKDEDTITTVLTNDDSVAAGEHCIVKLARDVALDSATGNAEVITAKLQYTTT